MLQRTFHHQSFAHMGKARVRGVTLIELLVAMAMLAILLGLAIPSFVSVINSNRISSHANELVAGIQGARIEAIRRNASVVLCNSDGATCIGGDETTGWTNWISFVDQDGDGQVNNGETLLRTGAIVAPVQVHSSAIIGAAPANNSITIRSDGMAREGDGSLLNGQVRVCLPTAYPSDNWRDIEIDAGSRMTVRTGADALPDATDTCSVGAPDTPPPPGS